MNWQDNLKAVAQLAGDAAYEQDPDFQAVLPSAITYAENRILRDLDLLATRVEDDTGKCTQNRRQFVLPNGTGTFIVVEVVRLLVGGVYGAPLLPVSREALDSMWPAEQAPSQPSIPQFWAPVDQATLLLGPPPDQDYGASVFGTMRPASLSPKSAQGTFISTQLPDLFLAAQMCWLVGGWQRKWNAPQGGEAAGSWDGEYERLKAPALIEEVRKRVTSSGWSARLPNPAATPPQT